MSKDLAFHLKGSIVKFSKNKYLLVLMLVLLIGLFFRIYQPVSRLEFAHDGDLYSWIVKDIVVDHHFRLIGQLTSAPGIFIGPLFYYLLIPFFLLTHMDPVGAIIPITIIGILTVFSYWWVFTKLYNKTVGLVGSFLQAVLLSPVYFDRAVVPSTPTNLWVIWYFYCVVSLGRGNFNVLWILGLLIGLVWHIHIALLPPLAAIPIVILLSKKLPDIKNIRKFLLSLSLTSIPLALFEIRHNFSQTKSLYTDFFRGHGAQSGGAEKINLVLIYLGRNLERLFAYPQSLHVQYQHLALLFILAPAIFTLFNLLKKREALAFSFWIIWVVIFYGLSASPLSEYYLTNLEVIAITLMSFLLAGIYKLGQLGKLGVFGLLVVILIKNFLFFINQTHYQKGYKERKAIAQFIAADSRKKGFPCVAVSYITTIGENVGLRYFFWLNRLHVNQPNSGSPVYTIVLPKDSIEGEGRLTSGQLKVLGPDNVSSKEVISRSCSGQDSNLTDSMFGFTK